MFISSKEEKPSSQESEANRRHEKKTDNLLKEARHRASFGVEVDVVEAGPVTRSRASVKIKQQKG